MSTPNNSPVGEQELETINPKTGRIHLLDPSKWHERVTTLHFIDKKETMQDENPEAFSIETKRLLQSISSSMKELGFTEDLKIYKCVDGHDVGRVVKPCEYEEIDLEGGEGLPIKEAFPGPEGDLTDRKIFVTHLEEKGINVVNSDVLIDGCNALKNYLNMKSSWQKEEWAEQTNNLETFFQNLLSGIISQETRQKASRMRKIKQKKDRRAAALVRFKIADFARAELENKNRKERDLGVETTRERRFREARERHQRIKEAEEIQAREYAKIEIEEEVAKEVARLKEERNRRCCT